MVAFPTHCKVAFNKVEESFHTEVYDQLNLETETELFAFFVGLCAHFQALLPSCCVSLARLAMHFSEFLALEMLHTTWEAGSNSNQLCTFPRSAQSPVTVTGRQLDPKSSDSYCASSGVLLCTLAIVSIPGLKQLSFPAGLLYGGGWMCDTLVLPGSQLGLSLYNCLSFPPEIQHQI